MDGGRENCFLAGGAEISRRGGGITAAPVHTKQKPRRKTASELLRFQIVFIKQRRGKKAAQVDLQSLTKLVDDPQLHRRVCAVHKITDGGLRYAAFHIKLILRHATLLHQLNQTPADGFIQLQVPHLRPCNCTNIIFPIWRKLVQVAVLKKDYVIWLDVGQKAKTIRMTLPHPCKTPMGKVF